ncbi:MAG TPA: hypothetical protein VLA40_04350 [Rheinheimera sp.]|nr:hypothetical protein [Rheinheimera sp.]
MYKIQNGFANQKNLIRLFDNANIPFDPANTDYAEFKKAVTEGAELQDADGNVMTAEAAKEFVKGLA